VEAGRVGERTAEDSVLLLRGDSYPLRLPQEGPVMTLSPFRLLSTRRQDGESGEEDGCGDNCKGRGEHEQCKSEEAAEHQIEHGHLYSSHLHQVLSNPPDLVVYESLHVTCHVLDGCEEESQNAR
jgi:hypothetical protein